MKISINISEGLMYPGNMLKWLAFLVLPLVCLRPAEATESCDTSRAVKEYPQLTAVLRANADLELAGRSLRLGFDKLVQKGKALEALANKSLSEMQRIACKEKKAREEIKRCTGLIHWSCESLPVSMDLSFLASVPKNREQELIWMLQPENAQHEKLETFLFRSINFFDVCCDDFGCADSGAGIPALLYNRDAVALLVELASIKGPYGEIALQTLIQSDDRLGKAKCVCQIPIPQDMRRVVDGLKTAQRQNRQETARQRQINVILDSMISHLSKLPEEKCRIPKHS